MFRLGVTLLSYWFHRVNDAVELCIEDFGDCCHTLSDILVGVLVEAVELVLNRLVLDLTLPEVLLDLLVETLDCGFVLIGDPGELEDLGVDHVLQLGVSVLKGLHYLGELANLVSS